MNRFKLAVLMIAIAFCAGCFVAPPHEAVRNEPGPYPQHFKDGIRQYLKIRLKHPESVKGFTVAKAPEKIRIDTSYPLIPLYRGQKVWECFVVYDAKNDRGKYIGRDLHVVWIRYNRIVAFDYKEPELEYRIDERMRNPGY